MKTKYSSSESLKITANDVDKKQKLSLTKKLLKRFDAKDIVW